MWLFALLIIKPIQLDATASSLGLIRQPAPGNTPQAGIYQQVAGRCSPFKIKSDGRKHSAAPGLSTRLCCEEILSAPTLREEDISTCGPGHQATACPCVCASELISSPPGCSGRAEWYSGAVVRSDNRCSDQELGTPHQQL